MMKLKKWNWKLDRKTCPHSYEEFMKYRGESMYTVKEMANVLHMEEDRLNTFLNSLSEMKKYRYLEDGCGEWLINFKGAIYLVAFFGAHGVKPDVSLMDCVDRFEDLYCRKNGI